MSSSEREISIHRKDNPGADGLVWVVRDFEVPAVGDMVSVEDAEGKANAFKVLEHVWVTAKQGEISFARVRLVVEELKASSYSLAGAL